MLLKPKIVTLLSGGLDSVTMLYMLHADGVDQAAVSFNYQQPHLKELGMAAHHCTRLGITHTTVALPRLGGLVEGQWVVPNRNAIFLAIGANIAVQAGAEAVAIGSNLGDAEGFPDCRPGFLDLVTQSLRASETPVRILAPFLNQRKWEILDLARQLGVDPSQTWSCYRSGSTPCGNCPACLKMQEAVQ